MLRRIAPLTIALALFGCGRARESAPPPSSLEVELGGCARVVGPETCEVGESRVLRLWARDAPAAQLALFAGDVPVAIASPRAVQGGTAFEAHVPRGSSRLVVTRALQNGAIARRTFVLAEDDAPPWLGEVTRLRTGGRLDAADALLDAHDREGAGDRDRAWAAGQRARVALRRNEVDRAATLFREAIARDHAASLLSNEGDDAAALAYLLSARKHDTKGALDALAAAEPAFARYSEGKTDALYSRGIVLYGAGDARNALRVLANTIATGERLALDETVRSARATIALQLEYLGRWREALVTLQGIAASDGPSISPCAHASVLVNIGEGRLLAEESGAGEALGDPLEPLEEALAIHRSTCSDAYERALALSNAAQASIRHGDASRARAFLDEARRVVSSPEPYLEACFAEVLGRIALAEKRYEAARASFTREARIGEASLFPVERWRGAFGLGETLEAMGHDEAAVAAYDAAERALDDAIARVPLGEGRASFAADREASARNVVDLLVRMNEPGEALRRARIARARVVTSLASSAQIDALLPEARQRWLASVDDYRRAREALAADAANDWRSPKEQLDRRRAIHRQREAEVRASLDAALAAIVRSPLHAPSYAPPADRSLILAYVHGRNGWIAFAATKTGVRARPFELPGPEATPSERSAVLLDPFAREIARAAEIVVMGEGAIRAIDLHALPFRGAPLSATVPVRYGLDLDDASPPAGQTALVLSDPTGDLEEARLEGAHVRATLERWGKWPVRSLTGAAVTPSALSSEVAQAALVHFAGHGAYVGREGWESGLQLAHGARWSVGDVLALAHTPAQIVLSACDAARSSGDAAEGLGLAQAFLVAGARVVVAPTRPVKDALARAMSDALYASLARGLTLVAALREAGDAVRAGDATADWSAFRALSR